MKTSTMNEILKEMKELEVAYINFNGYYSNKDDQEELNKHTYATEQLYNLAFNNSYKGKLEEEDYFQGVCFDTDNCPLGEWFIDGTEEYFSF